MKTTLRLFILICSQSGALPGAIWAQVVEDTIRLPTSFVYVQQEIPTIKLDMRYAGSNNFVGRPIDGYHKATAILSKQAVDALKMAASALKRQGIGLTIFDAYRPQRAVDHFVRWSHDPTDTVRKADYYPDMAKPDLFTRGYIAKKSGHSRGSTVDLTLYYLSSNRELDMGGSFDWFGSSSAHGNVQLTAGQLKNRKLLRTIMEASGFVAYEDEWWHYTLLNEPFPDTYFDFPVH
ncbi:M15 family metallopeptidase [Sphingobacterium suaedae]|uniref:D-alanyl-D-alanine dipeptidase n=1 Tax=Sphingobacterium suaedae TaxID=1686402 RepID=A0ABW5KBA2_9SPHI